METDQNPVLSEIAPRRGVSDVIKSGNNYVVVKVNEFLPSQPKKMNEVRGLVIADYQNYLEKKWVKELRSKYEYTVNTEALEELLGN
jgi:peptidyl-prolyl cis-trans isomerase SurA